MFARTDRLTLRPAWPEDAAALAVAIDHPQVARMLSRVPFPGSLADPRSWIDLPRGAHEPRFVIETRTASHPTLVGGIAISDDEDGQHLGYWLTPSAWGRGYATEAGHAVVEMARHALPIDRLHARHFFDNPASGRVLGKLGFRPTRLPARRRRKADVEYVLDLRAEPEGALPIAA